MAARLFNKKQALEREVKDLYVKVSIGASGAPTLVSTASYGSASITRNSAGDYSLTLSDVYNQLKYAKIILSHTTAADLRFQIHSETVSSTKIIRFFALAGTTKTDPANGSQLVIKLELKNVATF